MGWGPICVTNRAIKVEVTGEKRITWMTKEIASGHRTASLPVRFSMFCPQMIKLNINWSRIRLATFSVSARAELICSPVLLCWRSSSNTGETPPPPHTSFIYPSLADPKSNNEARKTPRHRFISRHCKEQNDCLCELTVSFRTCLLKRCLTCKRRSKLMHVE